MCLEPSIEDMLFKEGVMVMYDVSVALRCPSREDCALHK